MGGAGGKDWELDPLHAYCCKILMEAIQILVCLLIPETNYA